MSHQFSFYLTPTDTDDLEARLRNVAPLLVLHSRSSTCRPQVLDSLNYLIDGKPWLFLYLVRPEDIDAVVMRHVPAQGYWTVDDEYSPVIEVTRCYFDGSILRCGRMYFVNSYYKNDESLYRKPEDFLAWGKKIFASAKKTLKKDGHYYMGADAIAWLAREQGRLVD